MAALMVGLFQGVPARATGAAACQLSGLVTLNPPPPVADAGRGTGSFSAAALSCSGADTTGRPLAGTAAFAGSFHYCEHNFGTIAGNNACHPQGNNGPTAELDPFYDQLNASSGQGIATHFVGSDVVTGSFPQGGVCTFDFSGHALVAQAEIVIKDFRCSGLPGTTMSGRATANDAFILTPCAGGACIAQVLFLGTIEVSG